MNERRINQTLAARRHARARHFLSANRGKKSITLDISKAKGQAIARELADISDVLIENDAKPIKAAKIEPQ